MKLCRDACAADAAKNPLAAHKSWKAYSFSQPRCGLEEPSFCPSLPSSDPDAPFVTRRTFATKPSRSNVNCAVSPASSILQRRPLQHDAGLQLVSLLLRPHDRRVPKPAWHVPAATGKALEATTSELVRGLSHPSRAVRLTAQRRLADLGSRRGREAQITGGDQSLLRSAGMKELTALLQDRSASALARINTDKKRKEDTDSTNSDFSLRAGS